MAAPQADARRTRPWVAFWVILSVAAHLLIFAGIYLFPASARETRRADPAEHLDEERLQAAAEKLQEINEPEIDENLARLEEMREQMEEIQKERVKALEEYVEGRPEAALEELIELLRTIIGRQEAVAEALGEPARLADENLRAMQTVAALEDHAELVSQASPAAPERVGDFRNARDLWKTSSSSIRDILQMQERAVTLIEWTGLDDLVAEERQAAITQTKPQMNGENNSVWFEFDYQTSRLLEKLDRAVRREELGKKNEGRRNTLLRDGANAYKELVKRLTPAARRIAGARDDHATALEQQRAILEKLLARSEEEALPDQIPEAVEPPAPVDPGAAVAEKLAYGSELERQIAQMHSDVQAVELARRTEIPFARAQAATQTPVPEPPALEPAPAASEVGNGEEFNAYKENLSGALAATSRMVSDAATRLAAAVELSNVAKSGVDIASAFREESDRARGDGAGVAADLPQRAGAPARPAFLSGRPGEGRGGEPFRSVLGSKLLKSEGGSAPWLGLNRWYVIGPFSTARGTLAGRAFPPEQGVDLDAQYSGANGKTLRWQYVHSPSAVVGVPDLEEFAIYYAYTELALEEAQEVWIATASDDAGRMWIDDQLVWVGTYNAKDVDWGFDLSLKMAGGVPAHFNHKGFRKVALGAGTHRILLRVENTVQGCAFSVYLKMPQ